ncbi:hypothetical protein CXF78_11125 [Shewanella sp. 11B5]|nr:hypothetical protein CXF78_11125 [Shewanella sp. 11B5]
MIKTLTSILMANFILMPLSYATEVNLGGFIKTNARIVEGDLAYQHSWTGSATPEDNTRRSQISTQESRLNMTIIPERAQSIEAAKGFVEIDFSGSEQGDTNFSNSYSPRLRHAYIQYAGLTAGQNWTSFINTQSFAETSDLGGALVGQAMVRQSLIRYQTNSWMFAIENPSTYGTDINGDDISTTQDTLPDIVIRYDTHWQNGLLSFSTLGRQLNTGPENNKEWGLGGSIAGKISISSKDDIRFQFHYGKLGRYVGTSAASDVYLGKAETTTAGMLAYHHEWSEVYRSNLVYGWTKTRLSDANRYHLCANVFTQLSPYLTIGIEVGRFQQEADASHNTDSGQASLASNYSQFTIQLFF